MSEERPRYLEPGGIRQIDHVLLLCPKKGMAEVVAFWRASGSCRTTGTSPAPSTTPAPVAGWTSPSATTRSSRTT